MGLRGWLSVGLALAMTAGSAARAAAPVLRVSNVQADGYPQVELTLNVLDAVGQPLAAVTTREVSLEEQGQHFEPLSVSPRRRPLDLAIVVDRSARAAAVAPRIDAAVGTLLEGLGPSDRVALVTYGDTARVDQELIADKARVKAALAQRPAAGGAALYDALLAASRELAGSGPRATLVLIAGGPDRNAAGTAAQSRSALRAAATAAHDLGIPIWSAPVGAVSPLWSKLSAVTGGQSYPAAGAEQLPASVQCIVADLRGQYRVTYRSPVPRGAGGARPLLVTFTRAGGTASVKARYAVPAPAAPPPTMPAVEDVEPEHIGPKPDMDPYQ